MRPALCGVAPLLLAVCLNVRGEDRPAPKKSDSAQHTQVLGAKGLRKQGTTYVLAREVELNKLAREVSPLQRAVLDASKTAARAEESATIRQEEIDRCTQQHAELAAQMASTTNSQARNNIILQSNALALRLNRSYSHPVRVGLGSMRVTKEARLRRVAGVRSPSPVASALCCV